MMMDLREYQLTFADEFDNRSISQTGLGTVWASIRGEWRFDAHSDIGFGRSSFVDPSSGYDPFHVEGGILSITAVPDRTEFGFPGSWESGLITTQGDFSQTYGYFEMRADLADNVGGWDAFWLLPNQPAPNPDNLPGWQELDIVEHYGAYNQGTYRAVHTTDPSPDGNYNAHGIGVFSDNPEQLSGFHTYGMDWQPDQISFYFDGRFMGSVPTPSDMHGPMYILANLATQADADAAGVPITMRIDYIRAYARRSGRPAASRAASDLNGDGTSDVLVVHDGTVLDWIVQGGSKTSTNLLSSAPLPAGWAVVGRGDFDGDGTSDLLLQQGGTLAQWNLTGGRYSGGSVIAQGIDGWTVVGTGDINGDGTFDVLLRNGGTIVAWIMRDGRYETGTVIATGAEGWQVVGTGDLNQDGTSDLVLQNGGSIVDWILQDGRYLAGNVLSTAADGWSVVGTGDFDGDGTADLLLQNGGTVVEWLLDDGRYAAGQVVSSAPGWNVIGTGDYNGDSTSDILLRSGSMVVNWLLQGGSYAGGSVMDLNVPAGSVVS